MNHSTRWMKAMLLGLTVMVVVLSSCLVTLQTRKEPAAASGIAATNFLVVQVGGFHAEIRWADGN